MATVRTVFQPDQDLEVSEEEARVLKMQGLLAQEPPGAAPTDDAVRQDGDDNTEEQ